MILKRINRNVWVITGIFASILTLSLMIGCGGKVAVRHTGNPSPSRGEIPQSSDYYADIPIDTVEPVIGACGEDFMKEVEELNEKGGRKPPVFPIPKVSLKEAEDNIGAKIRLPEETFGGKLEGIYNDPARTAWGTNSSFVVYDNGFSIGMGVMKDRPDYHLQAEEFAGGAKEAEEDPLPTQIAPVPRVVTIKGIEMLSFPPYRFRYVGVGGEKIYSLPPTIQWWDNGIEYNIRPWKLGLTEEQLIRIAESMY